MSSIKYSNEEINLRLKELVEDVSGGNASKFARKSGIKSQTLHSYLKGRPPNAEALFRICIYLEININWLLTGKGTKGLKEEKEKDFKSNYLVKIENWMKEVTERDPRKKDWFELQFERSFPEFTFWLKEEEGGQDNQHKQVA